MRKIETAFYSGLIIGAYFLSGCRPTDSGIPVSLGKGPEKTATPPPTRVVKETPAEQETIREATVNGFTVKVLDERKTKTPLAEYPDARKIAMAIGMEIPNPKEKMKQRMAELREWMETCRQEKDEKTLTIALVDMITDELGGRFGATVACPNRIEINPRIATREGFDRVQSHELGHWVDIILKGWGQTTEEEAEENAYRFRGLTTVANPSAQSPVPAPSSSCFVHRSRYGETTKEILAIYQSRNSLELVVKEMRYKNQSNTAAPSTRLGDGWEITICPK